MEETLKKHYSRVVEPHRPCRYVKAAFCPSKSELCLFENLALFHDLVKCSLRDLKPLDGPFQLAQEKIKAVLFLSSVGFVIYVHFIFVGVVKRSAY